MSARYDLIEAAPELPSRYLEFKNTKLHYVEQGQGDPILFLHGNPANIYLWRNVLPEVAKVGRAIALDLAGYGKSEMPTSGGYDARNQYTYLEGFIEKMGLKNIIVGIDLGSVLGLHYVTKYPANIKGIVITEGIIMPTYDWFKQLSLLPKMMFLMFRNKTVGKFMTPRIKHMIVPMMTQRKLSPAEQGAYIDPYLRNPNRREMFYEGPGSIGLPKKGNLKPGREGGENIAKMNENTQALDGTKIPILILHAKPGSILNDGAITYARQHYPNLTVEFLGNGKHFTPEDQPDAMGELIKNWLGKLQNLAQMNESDQQT